MKNSFALASARNDLVKEVQQAAELQTHFVDDVDIDLRQSNRTSYELDDDSNSPKETPIFNPLEQTQSLLFGNPSEFNASPSKVQNPLLDAINDFRNTTGLCTNPK